MNKYILAEIGKKLRGEGEEFLKLTDDERMRFIHLRAQFNGLESLYFDDDFPADEYKKLATKAGIDIYNTDDKKLEDFFTENR
jgi:hypothetical protein